MAPLRLNQRLLISPERMAQLVTLWKHIHHELLAICYVVMDAALLTPLGMGILLWMRFWPPELVFAWLCCLMLFAFNLSRLFVMFGIPEDKIPTWTAVALLSTAYLSIRTLIYGPGAFFAPAWLGQFFRDLTTTGGVRWPQAVGLLLFIIVAWMRGLRLATRQVDINQIGLRLRLGGLILAPIIVWFGFQNLVWDVSPYLLLFLLAALTAVALTRAEEIEKSVSGHSASLNPKWLSMIFSAALLTVIMAALIATMLSGDSVQEIVGWLSPVVIAIQFIFTAAALTLIDIIIPFWLLVERILYALLEFLIGTFSFFAVLSKIAAKFSKLNGQDNTDVGGAGPDFEELAPPQFNFDFSTFQQYSNLLIFLLIVAFILLVALTVSSQYRKASFDDRASSNLSRMASKLGGNNLVDQLLSRLGLLKDWRTAVSIRRIYRQMSAAAEANGYPRLPTETPYEFLQTLAQAWPQNERETQIITRAFVKVRYGELPENKDELNQIIEAWRTLEKAKPRDNTAVSDITD